MIAVIGMAGRFPGAPDLAAYWDLLCNGREGLTRLDPDELLAAGVPPETLADPRYVPAAATLDGFDRFDAGFWDIGGHEASLMDPQQRILLELAWHALEDAGIDARRTDASIGVFVGTAISTYLLFQLRQAIAGPSAPSQLLAMMGNDKDYMATQLAYRLDLKGPALSVQTACSSSLVAVHLACQSLLSGECDVALAGGVSVRVPHRVGYLHEAGGMVSPDGHCRSFADDAAGTVFGSGAGLVVLRRAEDAGHDRVRALLLGSAVNNDGSRKIGFTAPSQDRQAAVIAEAMAVADIRPGDVGCIEGHGTGTPLGDPVEVAALAAAHRGAPAGSVALGSAKSNIGHTETAAGVAGLIKAVLMLQHGTLVPTLHAATPSCRIAWQDTPFHLARETQPWTERLVAGVSSFGIGGTNAHVVLGRAPERAGRLTASKLVISARDEAALGALTRAYRDVLTERPAAFAALAGAATRRPRLPWWVAADTQAALTDAEPRQGTAPEVAATGDGAPTDLPLYPFQRSRHWVSSETKLLGSPVATPFAETLRQVTLDAALLALLRQHKVAGAALLPAALHLALFAEIGAVADVTIERPLPLDTAPALQLWQAVDGRLRVMVERDAAWQCLATARPAPHAASLSAWRVGEGTVIDAAAWAATMAESGLMFGPAFRPIVCLHRGEGSVRAAIAATTPVIALDAGLQALGAAVATGEAGYRPASIGRFAVTSDILAATTVLARLTGDAADAKTGDVLWLDANGAVIAEARGVVCRRVRGNVADMLYHLVWRPDADPALVAPHATLERLACAFARDALASGAEPARPAIARLLRRHVAAADPALTDPTAACRDLATRHPDHAAEITLVGRCGEALPAVLAGTRDPLDVLFGADDGAHGAYRASPLGRRLNRVAAAVAVGASPQRVIEIGGGTAATTHALRAALPDVAEYLFTDISPSFLGAAKRQFADWQALRTAPLDIARDPAGQGIATGAWDLVVAANVLHATPDLAAAVRHACRLLAPGGRLLLVEGTAALARLDITFGLTEDWTRQYDRGLRPDHPLVDAATWQHLLRDAGLQDIALVAELGGQVVLTAVAGPPRWVAVGRDQALADALGLPLVRPGATLPHDRLDGVVALAGLETDAPSALADLLALSRNLIERLDSPRLLLPAPDSPSPEQAALGGFLRTLAREHPALRPRSIGLDPADLAPVAIERALDDGEDRVAWRAGERVLARLEPLPPPALPAIQRLAHDLTLAAMPKPVPGPGEVLIRIRAAGLNYKDALTAAGQVPPAGPGLGGECTGEIEALGSGVTGFAPGDAVVAVVAGALATHVCADARLVLPKPPTLDYARAAAVPIAGVTAWHALRHLARIRPGQRVLVHAATGGVGWFALRIAQQAGAVVVATAGSSEKRARLTALGVQEVYSSRDTGFAAAAPVDVVFGALPEAQREAALHLLRPGGHYIEIGRVGVTAAPAGRADIAWHLVALDQVEAPAFAALLRETLDAVATDPTLLPPITTLPLSRAPDAFAAMMRAAHIGKLVALPTHPATIRANGSYLVTGGLGGLGPEIGAWLARRGAGGVVRLARRAPASGIPVDVVIGDVTDPAALQAVDAHLAARGLPPLRGVIHAAGVLEDGVVATLDPGAFARVAAPKLDGVRAIQARWPDLELLVGFSSAGALFGSAGQAAHTAASGALYAAHAEGAAAGRPAVAIDWGAWRDHGAALARGVTETLGRGMGTIATADGFAALDRTLESGIAHAAVLPIDRVAMREAGIEPALLRVPDDAPVTPIAATPVPAPAGVPPEDRRAWLQDRIASECAAMLAIRGTIALRRPLQELGLDSLAALELRNRLSRLAGTVLPASLLFDYPTVAALTDHLAATCFGLAPTPVAPPELKPPLEDVDLETVSDDDLDAALSAFGAMHGDGA
ncbi:MAG: beta-ketoacyl synthase N-terminal-like domain-containing protein [Acetobacteraceae bacterium]|nr:beta-ketoacyl synthase N-terminal-like domain-containing protein [Acetobacteraceae bacterium]